MANSSAAHQRKLELSKRTRILHHAGYAEVFRHILVLVYIHLWLLFRFSRLRNYGMDIGVISMFPVLHSIREALKNPPPISRVKRVCSQTKH
jgi:hypothetical protein